jgi:hypothetical protein
MAMQMQKDIPIHIIWLRRNCLLLLALIFHLPIQLLPTKSKQLVLVQLAVALTYDKLYSDFI